MVCRNNAATTISADRPHSVSGALMLSFDAVAASSHSLHAVLLMQNNATHMLLSWQPGERWPVTVTLSDRATFHRDYSHFCFMHL